MRTWCLKQILIAWCLQFFLGGAAWAVSSSSSFSINEDQVGGIGDLNSSSASYKSLGSTDGGSTLGDSAIGNSSSNSYQVNSGYNTSITPTLSVVLNTPSVTLGNLSKTTTGTGTATFSITNYGGSGYIVQIVGGAPTSNGRTLSALSTDTVSTQGTEQFGINVVANTSPIVYGANPVQVPDATFGFGVSGDGLTGTYGTTRPYTIPNKYRYVSGNTIASSPKATGQTNFTISYLANISALTPAGFYTSNESIVVTGTF